MGTLIVLPSPVTYRRFFPLFTREWKAWKTFISSPSRTSVIRSTVSIFLKWTFDLCSPVQCARPISFHRDVHDRFVSSLFVPDSETDTPRPGPRSLNPVTGGVGLGPWDRRGNRTREQGVCFGEFPVPFRCLSLFVLILSRLLLLRKSELLPRLMSRDNLYPWLSM